MKLKHRIDRLVWEIILALLRMKMRQLESRDFFCMRDKYVYEITIKKRGEQDD